MALAKRQRGKNHENGTKENPRARVRTSGETNTPPSWLAQFVGQAQLGGDKTYKKRKSRRTETSHLGSAHPHVSLHFASVAQSSLTLCDTMNCSMPGFPVYHQLLEPAQTHVHWVSDAIQPSYLCHPLLLLPSIFPSIKVFSNKSAIHIRWPNYGSFSFSTSPSNDYSGLISFRIDWLLSISLQFKELLRIFSSSTVQKHQFFIAQQSLWSNSHIHTRLLENHSFD